MHDKSVIIDSREIVAYFDFDGTLTNCDTLVPFVLHAVGFAKFIRKLPSLIIIAILYLLKIIDNETA